MAGVDNINFCIKNNGGNMKIKKVIIRVEITRPYWTRLVLGPRYVYCLCVKLIHRQTFHLGEAWVHFAYRNICTQRAVYNYDGLLNITNSIV